MRGRLFVGEARYPRRWTALHGEDEEGSEEDDESGWLGIGGDEFFGVSAGNGDLFGSKSCINSSNPLGLTLCPVRPYIPLPISPALLPTVSTSPLHPSLTCPPPSTTTMTTMTMSAGPSQFNPATARPHVPPPSPRAAQDPSPHETSPSPPPSPPRGPFAPSPPSLFPRPRAQARRVHENPSRSSSLPPTSRAHSSSTSPRPSSAGRTDSLAAPARRESIACLSYTRVPPLHYETPPALPVRPPATVVE
ncbi:hypothetical protein A0H81_00535 [Grifola frondosa]|uniref:Uncharacterized protein n=1 Tax=Grifola frondosa TaxID=5627 RepID=A0A1C7MQ50_GRIFR|nr:hypothetical protein A0H81_00535 [Grifola frondosa]